MKVGLIYASVASHIQTSFSVLISFGFILFYELLMSLIIVKWKLTFWTVNDVPILIFKYHCTKLTRIRVTLGFRISWTTCQLTVVKAKQEGSAIGTGYKINGKIWKRRSIVSFQFCKYRHSKVLLSNAIVYFSSQLS